MKLKTEFDIFSVQKMHINLERRRKMQNPNSETLTWFKELNMNFYGLIEYLIESGNVYVKAQAILIKNVAVSNSRISAAAKQSEISQTTPKDAYFQTSDPKEQINSEMKSDHHE